MDQAIEITSVRSVCSYGNKILLIIKLLAFLFGISPVLKAFSQQTNKIQDAVNSIKEAYYCEDEDYHTDGQRTVWVKSYKKWTPEDLAVLKKEATPILTFLVRAVQHSRYDVLEQLLPDYYRARGGVKAFADDVIKEQAVTQSPPGS